MCIAIRAEDAFAATVCFSMQEILDQNMANDTRSGLESAIHFHDYKAVRRLGANSSSFPSAAEVSLVICALCCQNHIDS